MVQARSTQTSDRSGYYGAPQMPAGGCGQMPGGPAAYYHYYYMLLVLLLTVLLLLLLLFLLLLLLLGFTMIIIHMMIQIMIRRIPGGSGRHAWIPAPRGRSAGGHAASARAVRPLGFRRRRPSAVEGPAS